MASFKIVPYLPEHGEEIITFGMNDKLMEIDASFTDNRIDIALPGLSYSLFVDNNIVCAGGIWICYTGNCGTCKVKYLVTSVYFIDAV